MADRKYGRIFTISDLEAIVSAVNREDAPDEWRNGDGSVNLDEVLADMDALGCRFKFPANEPTFTFRARDKRAEGAIKHYEDHQSPNAPVGFTEGIAAARREFRDFREEYPELMKEPD